MLLIFLNLTHQNIVLQEAKKHLTTERNPKVKVHGERLMEIRKYLPPPNLFLRSCIRGVTFGQPLIVQNISDVIILELMGMGRSASPTFRDSNILEMKPQRGKDWLKLIQQLETHNK